MTSESRFWMRSVSFLGLRNLVHAIATYPDGLTAKEIDEIIRNKKIFRVGQDRVPSKTTMYHHRNILRHLNIILERDRKITINILDPKVADLLDTFSKSEQPVLTSEESERFANLVIRQPDCREFFFDLFLKKGSDCYDLKTWLLEASPVIWREITHEKDHDERGNSHTDATKRQISLINLTQSRELVLTTQNQIKAILYGVRYWARDEMHFVDELFREDIGNVMFPVFFEELIDLNDIIYLILNETKPDQEWTRFNLRDLALELCIKHRTPLRMFYDAVKELHRRHPGHMALIPTSSDFASLSSNPKRERFELKHYLVDERGRYISHVRLHSDLISLAI